MSLLEVEHLHTFFKTKRGTVKAVNDVTYSLEAGETLGIVGESGSGKSVSAMSILKLLDGNGYIESGSITFDGRDIIRCSDREMYEIRGNEVSVIFQEPMTSLNPVFTIGRQIGEVFRVHQGMDKSGCRRSGADACRGEDPEPGARGEAVSVSAFGRYAPACHDRDGATRCQTEASDRGRADDGARRDDPGADLKADELR